MKKLLAILLSVLMLCAMIPFATVYAAEGINMVMEISEEEVNIGDEFTVTVIFEGNPGIIAASVEILFDTNALEVAGEWEDGEFYPYIDLENARKWGANNITYGPAGTCLVTFVNGLATKDVTAEEFFTVTFLVKEGAIKGDYDLTFKYNPNNFFDLTETNVPVNAENGSIYINGVDAPVGCEHAWDNACDTDCNLGCGETRETEHVPGAAATCANAQVCTVCNAELAPATGVHTPGAAADCVNDQVCTVCGEVLDAAKGHDWADATCTAPKTCKICGDTEGDALGHNPGAAADCVNDQVCTVCGEILDAAKGHTYDYDCDPDCNVCYENRVVTHNVIHVPAKTACVENGNIEYWYCSDCGMAWLDAACIINTNLRAVITPAVRSEHGYSDDADIVCEYCGEADEARGEFKIVTAYGTSVSEGGEIAAGVAFRFNANLKGFALVEDTHTVDKENTNVVFNYNGVAYTMTGVGAVVSNKDDSVAYKLDAADGKRIMAVNADKLYKLNDYSISYVIRVIQIPESCRDIKITANPYLTGVDADGNEIALYTDSLTASYNG